MTSQYSLYTIPRNIYKVADPGHEPTESWYFNLVVAGNQNQAGEPVALQVTLCADGKQIQTSHFDRPYLDSVRGVSYKPSENDGPHSTRHHANLDELFDLRLKFSVPQALNIDAMQFDLTLETPDEQQVTVAHQGPVMTYEPKTELIFPLKTPCILLQGYVNNGGHTNWSSQFAIDAFGLTPTYGIMTAEEYTNETMAGWGAEIIAPADGVVTYARNDVPDNPQAGLVDDSLMEGLPEPVWANGGNCVVIDHGNGEYSVITHMQHGSVRVERSQRVSQGQVIGLLGNSGNSFGPHVHYHLQAGDLIFASDPLPLRFKNVDNAVFDRGAYITPT